jgi:dihydroorotate dehydrogenase
VPLVVKIAPDLTDAAIGEVLEVCAAHGVAGVIVSNTTLGRAGVETPEAGGLSGAPLTRRARELVAFVVRETDGRLPVIGVGGVLTAADATALFDAGAALVQVYTGLVYRGPGLVRAINKSVTQRGVGRLGSGDGGSSPLRAPQSDFPGSTEGAVTMEGSATLSGPVAREVSE